MRPFGRWPARLWPNSGQPAAVAGRRGREAAGRLPRPDSWSRLGLGGGRRRDSMARPGDVPVELGSGELSAGTTTRATVLVLGGAREGEELPICCGDTRGWKFRGAGTHGAR
jgi:hypothetical protein